MSIYKKKLIVLCTGQMQY